MSAQTKIEWTDRSWNPTRGCRLVSPGCKNCYAMKFAHRFSGKGKAYEGLTKIGNTGPVWTGSVRTVPKALDKPLRWKKPQRIFVNSMSDLFHEDVPDEFIAAVFGVMAACPQHTFQILTKRAARLPEWFAWVEQRAKAVADVPGIPVTIPDYCGGQAILKRQDLGDRIAYRSPHINTWPLPNVWLGVSVEDQERAEERIPHLLRVPAAVKFLSVEPLLSDVNLDLPRCDDHNREHVKVGDQGEFCNECAADGFSGELSYWHWLDPLNGGIGWVIAGGESGPGARPMNIGWTRQIVEQCKKNHVPVFVKQLGKRPQAPFYADDDGDREHFEGRGHDWTPDGWDERDGQPAPGSLVTLKISKKLSAQLEEMPPDLRCREFPR